MTHRVGRFKHKTLAGCYYIRALTYATLSDCQKNLLAYSSVRRLSHLEQDSSKIHQALLGTDPSLWGRKERYTQPPSPTSTYRDLIAQFSKAFAAKESSIKDAADTSNNTTNYPTLLEALNCSSIKTTVKHEPCNSKEVNSKGNIGNRDRYAFSNKDVLYSVSQSELKPEAKIYESNSGGPDSNEKPKKIEPDQLDLEKVKDYYLERIPYAYKNNEDLSLGLHHKDIVFENNYFQKQTIAKGLVAYTKEQTRLRFIGNIKFPSFFFQAVGATTNLDENCVKLHWRFYYIGNLEWISTYLWKRWQGVPVLDCYNFKDGISTLTVNKDGEIIKHQVDRLMPIQKAEAATLRPKFNTKLAAMMGLAPTPKASYESTAKIKEKTEPQG